VVKYQFVFSEITTLQPMPFIYSNMNYMKPFLN